LAVLGLDFINPRNLIGALVPFLIVLAIGFGCRGAGRAGLAAGVTTCALFAGVVIAVAVSAQMQRPDWRGAAEALASNGEPRVFVVLRNGVGPLAYYLSARKLNPGESVRAREIDVLSTNYRVKRPPGPFRLVDQERRAPTFFLWRYRARRPRQLRLRDLAGRRVLGERSSVLLGR
jgi:hypothetical protein